MSCPHLGGTGAHLFTAAVSAPSPGSIGDWAATAEPVAASTTPTTNAPTRAVQPPAAPDPSGRPRRCAGRAVDVHPGETWQCPCRAGQPAEPAAAEHTQPVFHGFATAADAKGVPADDRGHVAVLARPRPRSSGCSTGFRREGPGRPGPSGTGARFHCRALPMPHARLLLVGRRTDRDGELFPMGDAGDRCSVLGRRARPGPGTRSTP